MPYLTPDALPAGRVCRTIQIPDTLYFIAAVSGALRELTFVKNWEQFGAATPEDTAQTALVMMNEYYAGENCMIGMVVPFVTTLPPANVLVADGSVYNRVDYPLLYAGLPAALIIDPDTFAVPDLRDVFVMSAGVTYPPLSTGGEAEHDLSITEMPTHAHQITNLIAGVGPVEAGVAIMPAPGLTSFDGGGQPHNNLPPYTALQYGVVAK